MKRFLLVLLSVVLFACKKDEVSSVTYTVKVEKDTQTEATLHVPGYSYQSVTGTQFSKEYKLRGKSSNTITASFSNSHQGNFRIKVTVLDGSKTIAENEGIRIATVSFTAN